MLDASLVDWSRAQFALTAIYHWLFVPLTLGLSFIMAITESIYVKTGNEEWKNLTKFWMKLFGINFVIGAATGIILEFEFGTNWSNYSWIVGDIFGAPLAVEGIMAFFLESTFIAVMFFGWNKVSKKFHLFSTWLVAVGSNLSALWILVANGWMNYPVGMEFNADTARSEMVSFWDLLFSPVTVNKFLHTISSSYVVSALFVIGVSAWFILKKRHLLLAKRSIVVAAVFGLTTSLFMAYTGDGSAYHVAQKQPAKLAAMEGLYEGKEGAGLVVFGVLKDSRNFASGDNFVFKFEIPKLLSWLGYRSANAYVPGINDLINGNPERGVESVNSKMEKGRIAVTALAEYKAAKESKNDSVMQSSLATFKANYKYIGYGYIDDPESIIPPIPLTFYSFHVMVALGFYFILLFMLFIYFTLKKKLETKRWLLKVGLWSIPLGYLASQLGWVVAEVGRQPWAIQDILPVHKATSHLDSSNVQITFILFAILFTVLLIAELRIMTRAIKNGPKE
ncbi:MAG: cytochrome ubiquinol oxidase subunit I [Bacteroidetes bacterium HGW-Bacteroidetes-21]|nr:MAG: cytochrome ubiquinol oxidase subunit I [Bacteroidetes bacterium HGW-Bacteroidetes-21]